MRIAGRNKEAAEADGGKVGGEQIVLPLGQLNTKGVRASQKTMAARVRGQGSGVRVALLAKHLSRRNRKSKPIAVAAGC